MDKYNAKIHREFVMLFEITNGRYNLKYGVPFSNNGYTSTCINTPHITIDNANLRHDVSEDSLIATMDDSDVSFYQKIGLPHIGGAGARGTNYDAIWCGNYNFGCDI